MKENKEYIRLSEAAKLLGLTVRATRRLFRKHLKRISIYSFVPRHIFMKEYELRKKAGLIPKEGEKDG